MKKAIMYKEQEVNWSWYYQPWGGELADGKRFPEKKRQKASRIADTNKEASLRVQSPDAQSILLRARNRNAILSPLTSPCSWLAMQIWLSWKEIYSSGKQSWVNLVSQLTTPWGRFQMCSSAQHYLVSCRTLSLLLPPSLEKSCISWLFRSRKVTTAGTFLPGSKTWTRPTTSKKFRGKCFYRHRRYSVDPSSNHASSCI